MYVGPINKPIVIVVAISNKAELAEMQLWKALSFELNAREGMERFRIQFETPGSSFLD